MFLAFKRLACRKGAITSTFLAEHANLLALRWDDSLAGIVVNRIDEALQSSRAVPFAAADMVVDLLNLSLFSLAAVDLRIVGTEAFLLDLRLF